MSSMGFIKNEDGSVSVDKWGDELTLDAVIIEYVRDHVTITMEIRTREARGIYEIVSGTRTGLLEAKLLRVEEV